MSSGREGKGLRSWHSADPAAQGLKESRRKSALRVLNNRHRCLHLHLTFPIPVTDLGGGGRWSRETDCYPTPCFPAASKLALASAVRLGQRQAGRGGESGNALPTQPIGYQERLRIALELQEGVKMCFDRKKISDHHWPRGGWVRSTFIKAIRGSVRLDNRKYFFLFFLPLKVKLDDSNYLILHVGEC